jgi:prepilin-type N-terminal cleavage/methylation domain-containing protein
VKRLNKGFTIVELLTVIGIIAILVGILIPSFVAVKSMAVNAKQKAQFIALEQGLLAYKNDQGDYPESEAYTYNDYSGAQKLVEALFGWDLIGFHPNTDWTSTGLCVTSGKNAQDSYDPKRDRNDGSLYERKGPYVDPAKSSLFMIGDIFNNYNPLNPDTYVLCDGFGTTKKVTLMPGKSANAGSPILYYKANTQYKTIDNGFTNKRIYNPDDNMSVVLAKWDLDGKKSDKHLLRNPAGTFDYFYNYISDPRATTGVRRWPYNPEGFILISAGSDGEYGTDDDVTNF